MNKLFVVLLIAFLVAVVYLRIGRATQQLVEPAAVPFEAPPAEIGRQAPPADPVVALEREIVLVQKAIEADAAIWELQLSDLRARHEKAQSEADQLRTAIANAGQEANTRVAERRAQLAELERQLREAKSQRPQPRRLKDVRLPSNRNPADTASASSVEAKLDLILQRLDSMEKLLQKLEGKPGQPTPEDKP
jgi:hypothetical protein